jgi:hypothetical protein
MAIFRNENVQPYYITVRLGGFDAIGNPVHIDDRCQGFLLFLVKIQVVLLDGILQWIGNVVDGFLET